MIASTALPLLALAASLVGAAPMAAPAKASELKYWEQANQNATDALAELEKLQAAAASRYGEKMPLPAPVGNWTLEAHNSSAAPAVHSSSASVSKAPTSSVSPAASKITSVSSVAHTSSAVSKTSSSAAAASASASALSSDDSALLALHNMFRAEYDAGSVKWNTTMAAYAQKAADTCKYGHTNGPYGENIAAGVGGGYDVTAGFDSWASEASKYNWSKPGYSDATGHFTQLVWKATTQIGCGVASCADGTIFSGYKAPSTYIVCEYYTAGNVIGDNNQYFIDNVGTKQG